MSGNLIFAIPGDIETKTGGYAYDRRVMAELRDLRWSVDHLMLPGSFPEPTCEDLNATAHRLDALPDGSRVLVDGLAFGAAGDVFSVEADRLAFVALVHHPLCLESGLSRERAKALFESEKRALRAAKAIIVTSAETKRELTRLFGIEEARITVALPGTDPREQAKADGDPPLILSVGTLVPRKGHDVLIEALRGLADLAWTCRIVGAANRAPEHEAQLTKAISKAGLEDRITLAGACDEVTPEFAAADIFALATRYEGYGMVFAEALAHGLPIVGTRTGAVPDVVPEAAGRLVPPDDPSALRDALKDMLEDPQRRRDYARGSWQAGQDLPRWRGSAEAIGRTLTEVGA